MVHKRKEFLVETITLVRRNVWALLASMSVFYLAYASPVFYTGSDPRLSLLVSQAILEQRTVKLDAYRDTSEIDVEKKAIRAENGHLYDYWPVGPSVFAVPFVWILNCGGWDMSVFAANDGAQNLLSAVLCALVFLAIYQTGRCYLRRAASLGIALVSVLGSALLSTMGTALWNTDFAVLFITLSLLLICRFEKGQDEHLNPYVLGSLFFFAFFCRATAAAFIIVVLAYLFLRNRRTFLKTAVTAGAWLALFVLWSWLEYGALLPPYYSIGRFGTYPLSPWLALYAHLLSPSRGLLTFSPFFAPVLVAAIGLCRHLKKDALFWVALVWLGLHIFIASNAERWWGGHSYGPRLDTEVIPALILITFLVVRVLSPELRAGIAHRHGASGARPGAQATFVWSYLVLGLVAILINTGQGLYNPNTAMWNGEIMAPDVDRHPGYLLDWRYPQFLASNRSLCAMNREHMSGYDPADLRLYRLGDQITYLSGLDDFLRAAPLGAQAGGPGQCSPPLAQTVPAPRTFPPPDDPHLLALPLVLRNYQWELNALFVGWAGPEPGFRWTTCRSSTILFTMADLEPGRSLEMELLAGSFGEQQVDISVNGARIGTLDLEGEPARHRLAFSSTLLAQDGINTIGFQMPDASLPDDNARDSRLLGLQFVMLRIYASP